MVGPVTVVPEVVAVVKAVITEGEAVVKAVTTAAVVAVKAVITAAVAVVKAVITVAVVVVKAVITVVTRARSVAVIPQLRLRFASRAFSTSAFCNLVVVYLMPMDQWTVSISS